MKKLICIFFPVLLGLTGTNPLVAQIQNEKSEVVRVYGNCNMCKKRIEKAAKLKNKVNAEWDNETKLAKISYDSVKTNSSDVLKRVALAGYDSDVYRASDDTYKKLHACCQYERPPVVKKE
ncbi:MAG: hypothetical protein IPM92_10645 [Saprospiraceae bacterium]|nr:hypothetical protein [Saprospiraceae bacterium]